MNRRKFLMQTVCMMRAAAVQSSFAGALQMVSGGLEVHVTLDPAKTLAVIPSDFMGLGYEISSVARPGLLSAQNKVYVQLVRTLGTCGVIRVGGNTADFASYSASGRPLPPPTEGKAGTGVHDAVLHHLGTFLEARATIGRQGLDWQALKARRR